MARCDGAVNAKLSNRFVIPRLCPLFDRWDAHPTLAVLDCTHPCYDSNVMAAMVEPLLWNHPLDGAATATAAQLEVACVPPSIVSFGTGRAPGPVRFCSERLAPSGEERTRDTSAQVERAALCFRHSDSGTHAWCGHATVMVLVSSAAGPRVSGCIRGWRQIGQTVLLDKLVASDACATYAGARVAQQFSEGHAEELGHVWSERLTGAAARDFAERPLPTAAAMSAPTCLSGLPSLST